MNTRAPRRSSSRKTGSNDGVAQVGAADVGEQHEAVDVEVVAAVRDLGDGGVDVGQRERGEQAEPAGMVDDGAPAGLVHLAGEVPSRGARRRGARRATRSTAATSRCPSRSITATCSSADHSGICGKPSGWSWPCVAAAPPGSRPGGSGRGRRSSRRVTRRARDPVERGCRRRARARSPCIEWPTSGNDRYSTVDAGAGEELLHPLGLLVGHRAEQEAGGLVDDAQVVGEQHGGTFTLRSIRSWSHDAADGAGPERPAPLGVVLLEVLRRLVGRPG